MKVFVNMKKLGSRRNSITQIPYELKTSPDTVQDLITQMVSICVKDYNNRMESKELLNNLSQADMENQATAGKISFGVNYGENKADEEAATANALQCFEDGIYRIFCGTEQLQKLEDKITLKEGCELTFVRLTMLSGRMWQVYEELYKIIIRYAWVTKKMEERNER